MQFDRELGELPTFVALDAASTLVSGRRGASVQLDDAYFEFALATLDDEDGTRCETLRTSRERWRRDRPEISSADRAALRRASGQLRELLDDLPEVAFLAANYPGTCVAVPEWLRTGDAVQYGLRVYFFADDPPAPDAVVASNVDAVVTGRQRAFEAHKGRLHGYPECCIAAFGERRPDAPAPEWRSVAPLADRVDEAELERNAAGERSEDVSVADVVPGFFDDDAGYAFFAREFFPEPDCEAARTLGKSIFDAFEDEVGERLARDYFRCNYLHDYALTRSLLAGEGRRPRPGSLGVEHRDLFRPLRRTLTRPRYDRA